VLALQAQTL
jgi:hypothetical protein